MHWGDRKRFWPVVAATMALAMVMALPAAAEDGQEGGQNDLQRFHGEIANAHWHLDDDKNTSVSIGALDGQVQSSSGAPEDVVRPSVFVYQSFCDEAEDERVRRVYSLGPGADTSELSVTIDQNLESASVEGTATLSGMESRASGCDDSVFPPPELQPIDDVEVTVSADWTGVGDSTRMRSIFHLDSGDFKLRSKDQTEVRDAEVDASLSGIDVPELGQPMFARLASVKDSLITIGDHEAMTALLGAGGSHASTEEGPHRLKGESASAHWWLDDEHNTSVSMDALDGHYQSPPGPPEELTSSLNVYQSFCDEESNEFVFRYLDTPRDQQEQLKVDIGRRLDAASLEGTQTMEGRETRVDGCDGWIFGSSDSVETSKLGPYEVDVDGAWDGVGERVRIRHVFLVDSPDFKLRSQDQTEVRDAKANATLGGLGELDVSPELGEALFANLASFNEGEVFLKR